MPISLIAAITGAIVLLFIAPPLTTLEGLWAIQTHPSILITDYLGVGGLIATLLNVWLTTWISVIILHLIKARFSGVVLAGILTIAGFAFFGKNIWNFLPVWFGFFMFVKIKKEPLNNHIAPFLFSSGIAPLASFIAFGIPGLSLWASLPLGIFSGILAGFLTPIIITITSKFHQGYNLYNTGFGLGFIAMLFAGVLRAANIALTVADTSTIAYHQILFWSLLAVSSLAVAFAFILDKNVLRQWFKLLQSPGNIPSDYVDDFGFAPTLLNIGSLGLFSIALIALFDFRLSGPLVAAVFTLIAFGSYGKHIVNSAPVMAGLLLASLLPAFSHSQMGTSLALFFVTALAPIAGKFGLIYGLIAGFLHLLISPYAFILQGGFDLYNNGFVAGLVAGVIAVIAQHIPLKIRFRTKKASPTK